DGLAFGAAALPRQGPAARQVDGVEPVDLSRLGADVPGAADRARRDLDVALASGQRQGGQRAQQGAARVHGVCPGVGGKRGGGAGGGGPVAERGGATPPRAPQPTTRPEKPPEKGSVASTPPQNPPPPGDRTPPVRAWRAV